MPDSVLAFLIVASGLAAAQVAYLGALALASLLFRLPAETFSLGTGPELLVLKIGGARLRIAAFIFSSYVNFKRDGEDADWDTPSVGTFGAVPWWQRLIVYAIGPAAMIGLAAVLLGTEALNVAAASWQAIAELIRYPLNTIEVTDHIVYMVQREGTLAAGAAVAAFGGGMQFLPFSFMSGGAMIMCLAEAFHGRVLPYRLVSGLHHGSISTSLVLFVLAVIGVLR